MHVQMFAARREREVSVRCRHLEARAQRLHRFDTALFMKNMFRQHVGRSKRFAQIVGERSEADEIVARCEPRCHIADHFGMHARIDFGMELGALRHVIKRIDFRQHHGERTAVA